MRIGRFNFEIIKGSIESNNYFPIGIEHKYWYLWEIYFRWKRKYYGIEICRTDWNRCYKQNCLNYTKKCKHNMDCNACMDCYKEKE